MLTQYGTVMAGGQRMLGGTRLGIDGLGGVGPLALVGFFVLTALVAAVIVWAVARQRPTADRATGVVTAPVAPAPAGDAALAIARERLARGEIDPDQFVAIVAALGGQPVTPIPQG